MTARTRRRRTTVICLALAAATAIAAGCGEETGVALPTLSTATTAARTDPERPAAGTATGVAAGVDTPTTAIRSWGRPTARRRPDGRIAVLLRSSTPGTSSEAALQLQGVGFPGHGTSQRKSWVGPGVDLPWTSIVQGQYNATTRFSGRKLGLVIWSRGGSWRVKVDGRYVSSVPQSVGSNSAFHTLWLHFDTARPRTISYELAGGAWIAGLAADSAEPASLPAPAQHARPTVYWIGDSYSAGTGSTHPGFTDLVHVVKDRLGLTDLTIDALGGTGYVKTNGIAKFPSFETRAAQTLRTGRVHPDVVVVAGSINDAGVSMVQARAAAARVIASIHKGSPKAKIVMASFTPAYPVPKAMLPSLRGVASAARSAGVSYFNLPQAVEQSVKKPAKLQGTTTGHPTALGHQVYGRLLSDFLVKTVPALRDR
jgi:lysophospholipase L1-like esterase